MGGLDLFFLLKVYIVLIYCEVNLINQIFVGCNGDLIICFEIENDFGIQVDFQFFYLSKWVGFSDNVFIVFDLCLQLKIEE